MVKLIVAAAILSVDDASLIAAAVADAAAAESADDGCGWSSRPLNKPLNLARASALFFFASAFAFASFCRLFFAFVSRVRRTWNFFSASVWLRLDLCPFFLPGRLPPPAIVFFVLRDVYYDV